MNFIGQLRVLKTVGAIHLSTTGVEGEGHHSNSKSSK